MIKYESKKETQKGVEHTETLTQVGVDIGVPGYHVGLFFNRQKITDKPVELEKQDGLRKHEAESESEKTDERSHDLG